MKTTFLTICCLLSFRHTSFGETVNGYLMPAKCKHDDPKTHTAKCALICKSTGFGVVTADGSHLPFTPAGNEKAIALLESTAKTEDLQVSVQGTRQGDLLAVESITWK
ncbi:MAG: hypothetical protein NTV52_23135 [Acidobacteria bacterium]|nr:hypothetical protein [Acidobacteriota bacterium]